MATRRKSLKGTKLDPATRCKLGVVVLSSAHVNQNPWKVKSQYQMEWNSPRKIVFERQRVKKKTKDFLVMTLMHINPMKDTSTSQPQSCPSYLVYLLLFLTPQTRWLRLNTQKDLQENSLNDRYFTWFTFATFIVIKCKYVRNSRTFTFCSLKSIFDSSSFC